MESRDAAGDCWQRWPDEASWDSALTFVDLAATSAVPERVAMPPGPVIGINGLGGSGFDRLDTIIEAPATAEAVRRQVSARPKTAAVIVQLLRILPELTIEAGLTAESMAYGLLQGSEEHAGWLARRERGSRPALGESSLVLDRTGDELTISLSAPERGNTIDRHMRDQLHGAFELAAIVGELTRIRLRAEGRSFSLGAELSEFGTTRDPATAHDIRYRTLPARAVLGCADRLEVHVQGACVGAGLELAAFARRITASRNAWFQLPELAMGLLPGAGGCVSLTRRIGRQRTALMILSGKRISAARALDWGLIDAIVDDPA